MGLTGSKPAAPAVPSFSISPTPSSTFGTTSPVSSAVRGFSGTVMALVGGLVLFLLGVAFYDFLRKRRGQSSLFTGIASSGDVTPSPVDGTKKTVISSAEATAGSGTDYAIQYWMFIKDWDYRFSQEKQIVKRVAGSGSTAASPYITLHPTDNSLQVRVAIFPNTSGAGSAATPTSSSTGDSFTCTVENVPLQTWFSVSVTVFQRNLDIYINGRLVKSCVLPGVPKPVSGDIIIGDGGGFSGSVCNLHTYPNMIGPNDAKSFYDAGTKCRAPTPTGGVVDKDSTFITIFGYTFRFSTLDKTGKELSSYTL